MNDTIRVIKARSSEDIGKCYALRMKVFVDEQGVPAELEVDELDQGSDHYLLLKSAECIAVARICYEQDTAVIGRLAVVKAYRGKGIGHMLMHQMLKDIIARAVSMVELGAQVQAVAFYEKLGFKPYGELYDDAGIPQSICGSIACRGL